MTVSAFRSGLALSVRPNARRAGTWWLVTLALLATAPASSARAEARLGPGADSLEAALRRAKYAVVARVVDVRHEPAAEHAEMQVLERLKGEIPADRITVVSALAPSGNRLPEGVYFTGGETVLALLTESGRTLVPIPRSRQARVVVDERRVTVAQIGDLLRGYLEGIGSPRDEERFKAFLLSQVALGSPELRRGVLFDLTPLMKEEDLPFLRRLLSDGMLPDDLRVWAVRGVATLRPASYPPELGELLERGESVQLRQAVLAAYGARRNPADLPVLQRGLEDASPEVRRVAVESLGLPDAVPLLRDHFERESSPEVRIAIVRKLSEIASPEAIVTLRRIRARATDPKIREESARALKAAESAQNSSRRKSR